MSSWTDAFIGAAAEKLKVTMLERFTREDWLPEDGVKVMSEKVPMTMKTLPYFMHHFNNFVRKHAPQNEKVLMTMDGHSSRKGISWLEEAAKRNIELAKTPANTSHIFQPCDQKVNKVINSRVRRFRDRLIEAGLTSKKSVTFKFISALADFDDLSLNDIRVSFSMIGLWPMDMRFVKKFETARARLKTGTNRSSHNARKPDSATGDECRGILQNGELAPENNYGKLQLFSRIVKLSTAF